jgi:nicotinate phosphoribosyltransferase
MGFIADNYGIEQTSPLLTDKYHFTTAYGYWLEGRADNIDVSYAFARKPATGAGYIVAAGLEGIIDIVQRWQDHGLTPADLALLATQKTPSGKRAFPDAFIEYLSQMKFNLKIDAVPEGGIVLPQEPMLRVEGPIVQVKLLESVALNLLNGHSAYATHAAHIADAVTAEMDNGSPRGSLSVQNLRRGSGVGAAIESSRTLSMAGYASTSTGTAAKMFGLAFAGTMDHAWVMTHKAEMGQVTMKELYLMADEGRFQELKEALAADAFRSFAFAHPESGVFLLDTYDPVQGLENAITVIKELREMDMGRGYGVRFDSGDIVDYSKLALRRFAEEGFVTGLPAQDVAGMSDAALLKHAEKCEHFVAAADGIDEYTAREMRERGAFFHGWGIGTGATYIAPLGVVYKASSFDMEVPDVKNPQPSVQTPVMKVASNAPVKSSNPGCINARRYYGADGCILHTVIFDDKLGIDSGNAAINLRDFNDKTTSPANVFYKDVLVPVFDRDGKCVYQSPAGQKETFPGSGIVTTDIDAMRKFVQSQVATLPPQVRRVQRPREEALKEKLLQAYLKAAKSGDASMTVDIKSVEAQLPETVANVPVYLDAKLFAQRMAVEEKHLGHANKSGVENYTERFEAKAKGITP